MPECKKCPRLDSLSIQEEVEQKIIDCGVEVDIERGITSSALPFVVSNPDLKLVPNEKSTLKIYKNQITMLDRRPANKLALI